MIVIYLHLFYDGTQTVHRWGEL